MMTVFLKSTVRPLPSVSRPSSRICSSTLNTSGCAFSISSNSITAYGRRRTCFGKLPAFFVAHVSRRRADQPRHGVLLHVLGHVDAHHRVLVIKQKLGQRPRQFGFADAGRAQKDERTDRPLGIAEPARDRRTALATRSSASSWPTTRWRSAPPSRTSFFTSPSSICAPECPSTWTRCSAMSSSSTSSLSMRGWRVCRILVRASSACTQLASSSSVCAISRSGSPPPARRLPLRSSRCSSSLQLLDLFFERSAIPRDGLLSPVFQ